MKRTLYTILAALAASFPSCATLAGGAGGPPFVGFSTVSGAGDLRTDGDAFLAMGDLQGEAGLFLKGSGLPLTFPVDLRDNAWRAVRRSTGEKRDGVLGQDKLPAWTAGLFRPGEAGALSAKLGVLIEFEVPPYTGPGDTVPAS